MQKVREAERAMVVDQFREHEGEIITWRGEKSKPRQHLSGFGQQR